MYPRITERSKTNRSRNTNVYTIETEMMVSGDDQWDKNILSLPCQCHSMLRFTSPRRREYLSSPVCLFYFIHFYLYIFSIFLNVKGFFFCVSQSTIITIAYNSNLHNFISSDFTFLAIQFRVVDYIQRRDENKMLLHENIFLRID